MLSLWRRLPVVARAVLTGSAAALIGTTPWAVLVALNTRHWPAVPWAVPPTAVYLWFYWRYVRGDGWPAATAAARRTSCRANQLSADVWGLALTAGMLGLVALVAFLGVFNRLVRLPAQQTGDLSHVPLVTLLFWLPMGAIVAGVAEEASFRGYMQRPIERRHGPVAAIAVTGAVFGVAHFTHPEVGLVLMPYFLAVATVYGALAYLTDSIFPSMVLHAGGDIWSGVGLLAQGRAEWQVSPKPKPLIWETGADPAFWTACVVFVIATTVAVAAYVALARAMRQTSEPTLPVPSA